MKRIRLGGQTLRDYAKYPEHVRVELIAGRIVDSLKRTRRHQEVLGNLLFPLAGQLRDLGTGSIVLSPYDCVLGKKDVIQPDLVYVSMERKHLMDPWLKGPPDVAIEILGDSVADRAGDRLKMDRYRVHRVPQCWLVDPKQRTITIYLNRRKHWRKMRTWRCGEILVAPEMRGVIVAIDQVFAN